MLKKFCDISAEIKLGESDAYSALVARIRPELLRFARYLGSVEPEIAIEGALAYGLDIVESFDSIDEALLMSCLRRMVRTEVERAAGYDKRPCQASTSLLTDSHWDKAVQKFLWLHEASDPASIHHADDFHSRLWLDT